MPVFHPHRDDAGQPVILLAPSTPMSLACWEDPKAIARVIPDGPLPERLNGLALVLFYSGEAALCDTPREAANATQAQAPHHGGDLEAPCPSRQVSEPPLAGAGLRLPCVSPRGDAGASPSRTA